MNFARIAVVAALFAAPSAAFAADGAELFKTKACMACHDAVKDQSTMGLGPSIAMIKTSYAAAGGADGIAKFLAGEGTAIVKPELAAIMAGQVAVTKTWTADERKAVAEFLMK